MYGWICEISQNFYPSKMRRFVTILDTLTILTSFKTFSSYNILNIYNYKRYYS